MISKLHVLRRTGGMPAWCCARCQAGELLWACCDTLCTPLQGAAQRSRWQMGMHSKAKSARVMGAVF